jgi:hypothetical protein
MSAVVEKRRADVIDFCHGVLNRQPLSDGRAALCHEDVTPMRDNRNDGQKARPRNPCMTFKIKSLRGYQDGNFLGSVGTFLKFHRGTLGSKPKG